MKEDELKSGRKLFEDWFRRVWEEEDASAILELYTPEPESKALGAQTLITPDEFTVFHQCILSLLSDILISIDHCLDDGEWTSVLCTLRAKSKATGEPVMITGTVFARIREGRIVEGYDHFDFINLWGQLGILPPDCFAQGLMGQKLI